MARVVSALIAVCVLMTAGCSGSDGGGPALVPVTGKVVFKNEGLTAASIYFIPDAEKGNRGQMASSVLQMDGSFTMETYPKGAGVVPGSYKVTITASRRPEKELKQYGDAKTTPLTIDVPEGGISGHIFELK
jgi:hypothetical protein